MHTENGKSDGPTHGPTPAPTSPPKVDAPATPELPAELPAEGGEGNEAPPKKRRVSGKTTPDRNTFDSDVAQLVVEEPPIILRREQLNSNFRAKAPEDDEEEDEEGDETKEDEETKEGDEEMVQKKPAAKGKAKAKAKAAGKAKAKAAGKAKAKAAGKAKAKAAGKAKVEKAKKAESKEVATFARRYCPTCPKGAARHQAIQTIYEAEIASKVEKQSSFQVCLPWIICFLNFISSFVWGEGNKLFAKTSFTSRNKPSQIATARCIEETHKGMRKFLMWGYYKGYFIKSFPFLVQDGFYKLCMGFMRGQEDSSFEACCKIAQGLVKQFLEEDSIRFLAPLTLKEKGYEKDTFDLP